MAMKLMLSLFSYIRNRISVEKKKKSQWLNEIKPDFSGFDITFKSLMKERRIMYK